MENHSLTETSFDLPETEEPSLIEEIQDIGVSAQQAADLAKADLNFLAALAMPTVFKYAWPSLFLACWHTFVLPKLHAIRDFSKLALCLPRGFAKSTFLKLIILYAILFTDKKFILILAETATKAQAIMSDVIDMLEETNIKRVFGDWRVGVETNNAEVKKFGFRGRNIIIMGMGAGGSVRGLNMKNQRPDLMVFDDVQSREEADSELVSKALFRWMIGTAMKAKSPKGCTYLFVANMYPTPHSIMRKLLTSREWLKFKTGGIVLNEAGDGYESIWEELQPLKQLLAEYRDNEELGHPEIFQAEVLNDENASVNTYVDFEKIGQYPFLNDDIAQGGFIVIDPATDKANADAVSVGAFKIFDGKGALVELDEGRMSPAQSIRSALDMCTRLNIRTVFVEGVAYQSTLCYWAKHIMGVLGIQGINWIDIYPKGGSKNSRILTMFKQLMSQELFIHPSTRDAVFKQIRGFNALKSDNIDGILDLLTYVAPILTNYLQYLESLTTIESQEYEAIREYTELDNSPI